MPSLQSKPPTIGVVVFNQFNPFHISIPSIVFGRETLNELFFEVRFVAGEPGPLRSGSGFEIHATAGLEFLDECDIVIVPYWRSVSERPNEKLLQALRSACNRGALIVGLCLGAYVLGYADILSGKRAATHWEVEEDFKKRFPSVNLDANALFVEDGSVITSAGTAAGIDCCLYVFRKYYGSKIANRLARRMVVPPYRDGGQAQFIERPVPENTSDRRINTLLEKVRANLHAKYDVSSAAHIALMSRRTFTRKFRQATGMSFNEWLTAERLNAAKELLESSDASIEQIREKAGCSSEASFRYRFKQRFGASPSKWRSSFRKKTKIQEKTTESRRSSNSDIRG